MLHNGVRNIVFKMNAIDSLDHITFFLKKTVDTCLLISDKRFTCMAYRYYHFTEKAIARIMLLSLTAHTHNLYKEY